MSQWPGLCSPHPRSLNCGRGSISGLERICDDSVIAHFFPSQGEVWNSEKEKRRRERIHSLVHEFVYSETKFIEDLLCARHYSKGWSSST